MRKVQGQPFYFFTSLGHFTGQSACSFIEFVEIVKNIDVVSLEFHVSRNDFERWFIDVWGYTTLAQSLRQLKTLDLTGEELRGQMLSVLASFFKTLNKK